MIHALLALAASIGTGPQQAADPPRLVVVVSVDQMRADYLTRFAGQFSGGLARLYRDGARFTDAHQDHAITHTAAGHASISSGRFPAGSGIVSNDWWDRVAGRSRYAVEDEASPIVGDSLAPGRSPANLLQSVLGDWLKQASPQSKVYSVAIKDRAAILMGGKKPDGVYWYKYDTGRFVTSTYYRKSYPTWVQVFNDSGPVDSFFAAGWSRLWPRAAYYLSREDSFPAEGNGLEAVFPHVFEGEVPSDSYYRRLPYTPFGDQLVFEFAQTLITKERLGVDEAADILFIGASAADFIGHTFGPRSHEVQDYYLRLDRQLADLFASLDRSVGAGAYAVVLTGDHGVLEMPEELARRGVDAGRVGTRALQELLQPAIVNSLQELEMSAQPAVRLVTGLVVAFPGQTVAADTVSAYRSLLAAAVLEADFIEDAFTYDELLAGEEDRPFLELYRRSFHPDRSPDLFMRMTEHYLLSSLARGTSHGSPYRYDTHIPLVFSGPGIKSGTHDTRVRSVDIAPTIAAMLGIETPTDLDGRTLEWALWGKK